MATKITMAECAAVPAMFCANAAAYLGRLRERPSFARAVAEAQPYFAPFPE